MAQRQHCRQAVTGYNALTPAEKASFDLLDWYFANFGAAEPDGAVSRIAAWLGIDYRLLITLYWRSGFTPELVRMGELAAAAGLFELTGQAFDAKKWEIVASYLNEIS